jgi:F420H(2)-dependent quinone reductase
MAYLKPPTMVRKVFNPLAMRLGIGGSATLAVRRRTSGATQKVPVIPVELGGVRYVVSTRGESDWVRNVRAAGRVEVGGRAYAASEVAVAEREPIISAYRAKAGRAVVTYWKSLPNPQDHPTFRLDPS